MFANVFDSAESYTYVIANINHLAIIVMVKLMFHTNTSSIVENGVGLFIATRLEQLIKTLTLYCKRCSYTILYSIRCLLSREDADNRVLNMVVSKSICM